MSRIHDALRRGHQPAGEPDTGHTAHADAVLAALGYKSDKPRVALAALKLTALAFLTVVLAALLLVPLSELNPFRTKPEPARVARTEGRGSRIGQPPLAAPAPITTAPPAPVIVPSVTQPAVEKPRNDPRPSILDPRSPAAKAPLMPATKPPAPIAAASPPRPNPAPRVEKPRTDPRSSILDPRPPVVAPGGLVAPKPFSAEPATGSTSELSTVRSPQAAKADEFQLGLYYQRSGDFEQSLLHYRAALQRDEMNVEAHNNLGNLYLGKGLFEEASREFQRVIAIDPKYGTAHVNLSAAYLSLQRYDAAAAEARAALQIDPRSPDAMVNLSLAQNAAGQAGDAQGSLRRALEIDPHNAAAHYNLARQFEAAGEAAAAIEHYKQFIQYASPDQTAYAPDVRSRLVALNARIK